MKLTIIIGKKTEDHLSSITGALETTKADAVRWTILFASKIIREIATGTRSLLIVDNEGKAPPKDVTPLLP